MSLQQAVSVVCPFCGEVNELVIDKSVSLQEYIEDCTVCCHPMLLRITVDDAGGIALVVRAENE